MLARASAIPTMDAVAREAGVAISTVSRALRDDRRIGPTTRRRIKAIAAKLGYRPNPMVAALMAQLRTARPATSSCNLAWLDFLPQPNNWTAEHPILRAFFFGAQNQAQIAGYAMEAVPANLPGLTRARLAQILESRGVRGVLLPYFEESRGLASSIPLPLDRFTIVTVGTRFQRPALNFASNDQYASSRLAVLELWQLGYRRIGYVGTPFVESVVNSRFCAGYLATLQLELNTPSLPPLLTPNDADVFDWLRVTQPEVILTPNLNLLELLRAQGIRVPGQLGLAYLHVAPDDPDTSGICQNSEAVGSAAVDLLIGQLCSSEQGVPALPKGVLVAGSWMPGKTVRRLI